jgi:cation diffusion facilitator CzcD-associated flavoprotein CzcO
MIRAPASDVVIIGAGPYGVAIAAHLCSAGVNFRVFGKPMERWLTQMPRDMYLKSEGCASSLPDPSGQLTLKRYCADLSLPYGDYGQPVARETFARYALAFQQQLAPSIEERIVAAVGRDRVSGGFELRLEDGELVRASKIVVATGLSHAAYLPRTFALLPPELRSHSADHVDFHRFKGQDVTVIGGGQSALETAALLYEAGASVRVLVRRPKLAWNPSPTQGPRSWWGQLIHPTSTLGQGIPTWFYANAPTLFYRLPPRVRVGIVRTALGPAGAWWLQERIIGRVPILPGHTVSDAEVRGSRALLHVERQQGDRDQLTTDHVIAATGYRFAVSSLPFLGKKLASEIRCVGSTPVLSPSFESSLPGLYFVGLASANIFGPAMRFVHGTGYTAQRLLSHLGKGQRRHPLPGLRLGSSHGAACRGI